MENSSIPVQPFGKIALSCSGGGYRAASFHLGSMSYLNHVVYDSLPLLERVKVLSTVSGGSITGMIYALKKQEGASFDEFYNFLLDKLNTVDLLKNGIDKLNPTETWPHPYKNKNLINVFADQYDREFTNGALMSVFSSMHSHLEAVVFNCTEFENGVNFRFRNPGSKQSGNFYNRIPSSQLKEVKLSDVMAASSCFPGGFEPMRWPNDFAHDDAPQLSAQLEEDFLNGIKPLGVMDGGIYDNQGIDSILRYKEGQDPPYFDLIIISDVASPDMTPYVPFQEKPKTGLRELTLKELKKRIKVIDGLVDVFLCGVLLSGFLAPLFFGTGDSWITGACFTVAGFASVILIGKALLFKWLHHSVFGLLLKIRNVIPAFFLKRLANFNIEELSLHRIEPLLFDRFNSLLTLLSSVFLKVVRRLNYNRLYENEDYKFRRFSSLIKCLTRNNLAEDVQQVSSAPGASILRASAARKAQSFFKGIYQSDIGPEIQSVVEEAAAFGTTLWFTEQAKMDEILKKLVATGQITMCYNLILYLEQLIFSKDKGYEDLDVATRKEIESLYERCKTDWMAFKNNPLQLVELHSL
jgi:predicted acylesterase/phospholipase RssA